MKVDRKKLEHIADLARWGRTDEVTDRLDELLYAKPVMGTVTWVIREERYDHGEARLDLNALYRWLKKQNAKVASGPLLWQYLNETGIEYDHGVSVDPVEEWSEVAVFADQDAVVADQDSDSEVAQKSVETEGSNAAG